MSIHCLVLEMTSLPIFLQPINDAIMNTCMCLDVGEGPIEPSQFIGQPFRPAVGSAMSQQVSIEAMYKDSFQHLHTNRNLQPAAPTLSLL